MHKKFSVIGMLVLFIGLMFGTMPIAAQSCGPVNATIVDVSSPLPLKSDASRTSPDVAGQMISNGQQWNATILGEWAKLCNGTVEGYAPASKVQLNPQAEQVVDTIVLPEDLTELANGIGDIGYENPDQDEDGSACYDRMDMEESCSTREGQAVSGQFQVGETPRPELRLVNGDVIEMTDADGDALYERIDEGYSGTNHDLVILFADAGVTPVQVNMVAEFGSFRADFAAPFPSETWSVDRIETILGNQLRMIFVESDPAIDSWLNTEVNAFPDGPHPYLNPANCSAVADLELNEVTYCSAINVYGLKWTGTAWETVFRGIYGVERDATTGEATRLAYMNLLDERDLVAAGS